MAPPLLRDLYGVVYNSSSSLIRPPQSSYRTNSDGWVKSSHSTSSDGWFTNEDTDSSAILNGGNLVKLQVQCKMKLVGQFNK